MAPLTQAQRVYNANPTPVDLSSSFIAGFDPTGTYTFDLAQKAKRDAQHQLSGVAGGLVGGATIVPTAVGAGIQLSESMRGLRKIPTVKGKLAYLAQQAYRGAASPWRQLYHGLKSKGYINRALASGRVDDVAGMQRHLSQTGRQAKTQIRDLKAAARDYKTTGAVPTNVIHNVSGNSQGVGGRLDAASRSAAHAAGYGKLADKANKADARLANYSHGVDTNVMNIHSRADRKTLKGLRTDVSEGLGNVLAGIGASAALGGGSALLQYNQGRRVGDKLRAANVDPSA